MAREMRREMTEKEEEEENERTMQFCDCRIFLQTLLVLK